MRRNSISAILLITLQREVAMTIIDRSQLLSGLPVEQKYRTIGFSGTRTSREQTRLPVSPSRDTVEISPEGRELFHAQASAGNQIQTAGTGRTTGAGGAIQPFEARISLDNKIDQLKSEISSLKSEIAALGEKAATDDIAAALMRSKQILLQALQIKLAGLLAKSKWVS